MVRIITKIANAAISILQILILCIAGIYAGYSLWDNHQVYAAAENVQADMIKLKPVFNEKNGASFDELLAVNQDVCAWVTIDNTHIDFPVLQGNTNLDYINHDVYGNFALAGSIFLDSRNNKEFHDRVSLLYGHHMEEGDMFGDLDLFQEQDFFEENQTGTLILPDRIYKLDIFGCVLVKASEDAIFDPQEYGENISKLLDLMEEEGTYYDADQLKKLQENDRRSQILILSTCSTNFTDARWIVAAEMLE